MRLERIEPDVESAQIVAGAVEGQGLRELYLALTRRCGRSCSSTRARSPTKLGLDGA